MDVARAEAVGGPSSWDVRRGPPAEDFLGLYLMGAHGIGMAIVVDVDGGEELEGCGERWDRAHRGR